MLHMLGVIHRDLKRENILLTCNGHVVIADFSFAKYLELDEVAYSQVGTSGYVSLCDLILLIRG